MNIKHITTLLIVSACFLGAFSNTLDVQDEYIVVFKENAPEDEKFFFMNELKNEVSMLGEGFGFREEYRIEDFHAFLVKSPEQFLTSFIHDAQLVKYYEKNGISHIADHYRGLQCHVVNSNSWGLTRVSHKQRVQSKNYRYSLNGSGVRAYIIDTGINVGHVDFSSRASWGATFTGDNNNNDCNGHGTHVAGTVGGSAYGIAKSASLIAVKVLNCAGSGTNSGVISGIQWVAQQHKSRGGPSVANMSIGGGSSNAIIDAVNALVKAGVTVAAAAGNENMDACRSSPGNAPSAITVGSTAQDDSRSSFSNYGKCVDIFAPGSQITSAWIGSNNAVNTISGTSMATPHVCGVAAQLLGANRNLDPATVKSKILSTASTGLINLKCQDQICKTSPNRLLHSTC